MSVFKIVPLDGTCSPSFVRSDQAERIFHLVSQMPRGEADLWQDGVYFMSLHLGENGGWTLFQRADCADRDVQPEEPLVGVETLTLVCDDVKAPARQ